MVNIKEKALDFTNALLFPYLFLVSVGFSLSVNDLKDSFLRYFEIRVTSSRRY